MAQAFTSILDPDFLVVWSSASEPQVNEWDQVQILQARTAIFEQPWLCVGLYMWRWEGNSGIAVVNVDVLPSSLLFK